ncbi:MAG: VWA domain-containing protein [Verrucomicrobiota bacterium]
MKKESRKRRELIVSIIVGSIIVHLAGLGAFGVFVVAEYFKEPPAEFVVPQKDLRIPAQTPQHKMDMAKHEAMTPKPTFSDRLISTRPLDFALPDLPKVPVEQMLPLDPSELITDQINSLVGQSGLGRGDGSGLGGGSGRGSGFSFFGIKDQAKSVVIMIDVSSSMFGRTGDLDYSTGRLVREGKDQSFQQVREEAFKLIDSLGPDSRFGIIRWSGSARKWKPELVRATDENKAAGKAHIQNDVDANTSGPTGGRPGGTRHDYALEELFTYDAEVAYLLSDGNATASGGSGGLNVIPEEDLFDIISAAKNEKEMIPRIHSLYYLTGADKRSEERMLRGLSRRSNGKFAKIRVKKK